LTLFSSFRVNARQDPLSSSGRYDEAHARRCGRQKPAMLTEVDMRDGEGFVFIGEKFVPPAAPVKK
jgi:hypothetical protein